MARSQARSGPLRINFPPPATKVLVGGYTRREGGKPPSRREARLATGKKKKETGLLECESVQPTDFER